MVCGIDVSKHNGKIDWNKVKKSGCSFAIIRAGYGKVASQKDPLFEQNYKGARAAGIPVGAYWYSYALTLNDVDLEVKACLECIKEKQFEYPIFFDLEEKKQLLLGKKFCSEAVERFCEGLEKAGYWTGLYISRSPLQTHITSEVAKKYSIWIAEYNSKVNYDGNYAIWQKSPKWRVDGITGDVDYNICYVDFPTLIKAKGLNKQPVIDNTAMNIRKKLTPEIIDEIYNIIAEEVWNGKWGNGPERIKKLETAGFNPVKVQEKVNEKYTHN